MPQMKTFDASTLFISPLAATPDVVDGLITQGLNLFGGASKTGKSWLMLWISLCVSQGKPVWEGIGTRQTGVLYLALEDTKRRLQRRILQLVDDPDEIPENLQFAVMAGGIGDGLEEQIDSFMSNNPGTGLIIIDTLQKVRGAVDANTSSYARDYQDMVALKQLADHWGIAVVVVHHVRKQIDRSDPFNALTGSTGLTGAADTMLVLLKKHREDDEATLYVTGRDVEDQKLLLSRTDMLWQLEEYKDSKALRLEKIPPYLFRFADFLSDKPAWSGRASDVLEAVGETETSVQVVKKHLLLYAQDVLEPRGICFEEKRTGQARLLVFHNENPQPRDADDDHDAGVSADALGAEAPGEDPTEPDAVTAPMTIEAPVWAAAPVSS